MSKWMSVKSLFREYDVQETRDLKNSLEQILRDGDFLVVDSRVAELFKDELQLFLERFPHTVITTSEEQKSFQKLEGFFENLIESGFKKNHRLIAIGGGIVQDITAFSASILYRGVDWVFFPTTLLAQCDSCIGSKTSINFGSYKNQLGTFYPPSEIYIFPGFLETLEEADLRSGLGEMMHYYFIGGEEDFDLMEDMYDKVLEKPGLMLPLVQRSLEIKKTLAELDEFDRKERRIFNYGHSFGHAIESMTSYRIQHGIAVSIGMDIANYVAMRMGILSEEVFEQMSRLLVRNSKAHEVDMIQPEQLIEFLKKDKKNVDGSIRVILSRGFTDMYVETIHDPALLQRHIVEYFAR